MRRTKQTSGERIVKDIKRKTRKQYSAEEKIRILLDGLRGEENISELCRIEICSTFSVGSSRLNSPIRKQNRGGRFGNRK